MENEIFIRTTKYKIPIRGQLKRDYERAAADPRVKDDPDIVLGYIHEYFENEWSDFGGRTFIHNEKIYFLGLGTLHEKCKGMFSSRIDRATCVNSQCIMENAGSTEFPIFNATGCKTIFTKHPDISFIPVDLSPTEAYPTFVVEVAVANQSSAILHQEAAVFLNNATGIQLVLTVKFDINRNYFNMRIRLFSRISESSRHIDRMNLRCKQVQAKAAEAIALYEDPTRQFCNVRLEPTFMDKDEIESNYNVRLLTDIFLDDRNPSQFDASGNYIGSDLIIPLPLNLLMTGSRIFLTNLPQLIPAIIDSSDICDLRAWFYRTKAQRDPQHSTPQ